MTLGVTTGKFYPFHLGHAHLIREAAAQVDRLVVLLGDRPEREPGAAIRAEWIRNEHPGVEVIVVPEDIPNTPEAWAVRTPKVLGRAPDLVFTSESYGEPWARLMGARHVCVDLDRSTFPISGTQLRADLATHWDMLTAPAKAQFARRVRLVGVDSSGKTTLAQALAQAYQTAWVPEFGRSYWEGRRHLPAGTPWAPREFVAIAEGQIVWEDALAEQANRVLICDTDPLTTLAWCRRYLRVGDQALEAIVDTRPYALTLLTAPDFAFVQDGTRDDEPAARADMHRWLEAELERRGVGAVLLSGSPAERLVTARAAVEPLLGFEPLPEA